MKKEKGITLIALIVSIIIMLILVAVTITLVAKGGLIDKAKTARNQTNMELQNETRMSNEAKGQIEEALLTQFDFDETYDRIYANPTPIITEDRVVFTLAAKVNNTEGYWNFDSDPEDDTFSIANFYNNDVNEHTGTGTIDIQVYFYTATDNTVEMPRRRRINSFKNWLE